MDTNRNGANASVRQRTAFIETDIDALDRERWAIRETRVIVPRPRIFAWHDGTIETLCFQNGVSDDLELPGPASIDI